MSKPTFIPLQSGSNTFGALSLPKNVYHKREMSINFTFKYLRNVSNPNSIHGIYPYRGKISPIDATQIINQLPKRGILLDPFCGSGTIVYEAAKRGLNAIGVDNNPIAVQIAKAKLFNEDITDSIIKIDAIIKKIDLSEKKKMPEAARKYFHPDTANEIMQLLAYYNKFNDYEKVVFLGTICLAARACNNYKWSSTQIGRLAEETRYINFFEKFKLKLKKHNFPIKHESEIFLGDARHLSTMLKKDSIDFVYTSPPYFDALDYTSNYTRIIHNVFGNDIKKIKKGLIQNFDTYEADMRKCFHEILEVTKGNAIIIFVVGDKKVGNKIINGGEFFSQIFEVKPNVVIQRTYNGTASKIWDSINKTERKEQIIIWDRSTW